MKLVLYQAPGRAPAYGILRDASVFPLESPLSAGTPQEQLQLLIEGADPPRARQDAAIPLGEVRLLAPVPRPGKIVMTTATYAESAQRQQLLATLKSAESVIGPGDVVRLPSAGDQWQFVPQAALGLVMRGPAKNVSSTDWRSAVFGYTCVIDVMARGDQQFGRDFWLAKADTLGPLGPCIVTADELSDPEGLRVQSWQNGTPAQDFRLSEASHSIGEQVEFVTTVMTLHSGDVLVCGTSPNGQRPLADTDDVQVEIDGIGRLQVHVSQLAGVAA